MGGSHPREPQCLRREHGKQLRLELPQELSSGGSDLREILLIHQNMIDWHSCPDVRKELKFVVVYVMCVSYTVPITKLSSFMGYLMSIIITQGTKGLVLFVFLSTWHKPRPLWEGGTLIKKIPPQNCLEASL